MHTMSYDQTKMEELMTKVLDFTLTSHTQELKTLDFQAHANLLLSAKKSQAIADFLTDCTIISTNPQDTCYFIASKVTIQAGNFPLVDLSVQITTPEQRNYQQLTPATLNFLTAYLLEKHLMPDPFEIA